MSLMNGAKCGKMKRNRVKSELNNKPKPKRKRGERSLQLHHPFINPPPFRGNEVSPAISQVPPFSAPSSAFILPCLQHLPFLSSNPSPPISSPQSNFPTTQVFPTTQTFSTTQAFLTTPVFPTTQAKYTSWAFSSNSLPNQLLPWVLLNPLPHFHPLVDKTNSYNNDEIIAAMALLTLNPKRF